MTDSLLVAIGGNATHPDNIRGTQEEQEHAFTFAWRSPSASASGVPGRGIGLGVTKDLLEKNGGKISLLSEPGHGLEVTIMFPVSREAGA